MCRIILVRHGETDWNARDLVLGRTDIPLNSAGKSQAGECAERLKVYCPISAIYSSPLSRAVSTSEAIASQTGCGVKTDNRLIEQDFGIYEGVPRSNVQYQAAKREYFARYPEGESYQDVAARIYPFIEMLKERHSDDTVAIVTHGGICRVITNYFTDMKNEEFAAFKMENCAYRIFEV